MNHNNINLGDIYEFLKRYPEYNGMISVETRFGYFPILAADITEYNATVLEIKTNDTFLKCGLSHLLLDKYSNDWKKSSELKIGDEILTRFGFQQIKSIDVLNLRHDLYDIQVSDVEEYYSNDIVSHNSTILDAITFSLFGKPFRNISKSGLVNSINEKNCVTEIEFEEAGIDYKIVRGIKPNIFEIYRNDVLINQESATKDYQVILEQQILKMNMKTFTQVVILGSATYTPFMQLPSSQRREIIEDILDIRIFSLMNMILKEQTSKTKDEIAVIESALKMARTKVEAQQKIIAHLQTNKQTEVNSIQERIQEDAAFIDDKVSNKIKITERLQDKKNLLRNKPDIETRISSLNNSMRKVKHEIDTLQKSIEFFKQSSECPSCKQGISHEHSDSILTELNISKTNMDTMFIEDMSEYQKLSKELESLKIIEIEIREIENSIHKIESEINIVKNKIKQSNLLLEQAINSVGDIEKEKSQLKQLVDTAIEYINRQKVLIEQKAIEDVTLLLLKDSGIKSAIIKEYLPLINSLINKYLQITDFFVTFLLDEQFTETILSRNRTNHSYSNFSEGEKSRINIALLFAWREVAKLKNSANTNLLILDEIFSGAVDSEGSHGIMKLINSLEDTSVFVISHDQSTQEMFDNVITVEKRNDFSVIVT